MPICSVILAGGPSLTQADVDFCRGKATVIAVNDAYRLAPWADILYACDARWWKLHGGVPEFAGAKYALTATGYKDVTILRYRGNAALETDQGYLATGYNSGYQAINLAVHRGARRIGLLGFDMKFGAAGETHWFGDHPASLPNPTGKFFALCLPRFRLLAKALTAAGTEVVNCSRDTALDCFPRAGLAEFLKW